MVLVGLDGIGRNRFVVKVDEALVNALIGVADCSRQPAGLRRVEHLWITFEQGQNDLELRQLVRLRIVEPAVQTFAAGVHDGCEVHVPGLTKQAEHRPHLITIQLIGFHHQILGGSKRNQMQQALLARDKQAEDAAAKAQSTASEKAGFQDGYLVGKTDAAEGRARDGEKAMRLAKIHSESHQGDKEAYRRAYHMFGIVDLHVYRTVRLEKGG